MMIFNNLACDIQRSCPGYIFGLICLLLVGCSTPTTPPSSMGHYYSDSQLDPNLVAENYERFHDDQARYQTLSPKGWLEVQAEDNPNTIHFVNLSFDNQTPQASMTITTQPDVVDLTAFIEASHQGMRQQEGVSDLRIIQTEPAQVNRLIGTEQVLVYSFAGHPMALRMIYLQHAQHTFAISLMVESQDFALYQTEFEYLLRSFTAAY